MSSSSFVLVKTIKKWTPSLISGPSPCKDCNVVLSTRFTQSSIDGRWRCAECHKIFAKKRKPEESKVEPKRAKVDEASDTDLCGCGHLHSEHSYDKRRKSHCNYCDGDICLGFKNPNSIKPRVAEASVKKEDTCTCGHHKDEHITLGCTHPSDHYNVCDCICFTLKGGVGEVARVQVAPLDSLKVGEADLTREECAWCETKSGEEDGPTGEVRLHMNGKVYDFCGKICLLSYCNNTRFSS